MSQLKGLIKKRYPDLKGKDWINQLSVEDKQAVLHEMRSAGLHGVLGGIARAETANRDALGRFTR